MATQVAAGVVVPGEQGHLPREEPAGQRRGRPGRSPGRAGRMGKWGRGRGGAGGGRGRGVEDALAWRGDPPPNSPCGPVEQEDISGSGFLLGLGTTVAPGPK